MTVLESISDESVDMIICRGNTLPHLLTMENMKSCIKSFKRVCSPNGLLILQWLNYDLIKKTRKRQVGITGNETAIFHRFYDFISEDQITFNTVIMNYEMMSECCLFKEDGRISKLRRTFFGTILIPTLPEMLCCLRLISPSEQSTGNIDCCRRGVG